MTRHAKIAIVGMAARVPGAADVTTFWNNILSGHEAMVATDDETARQRGIRESTLAKPGYKRVYAGADGLDQFDAEFFGLSPREAELADPQFRLFLELSHAALESAGYDPGRQIGRVGVYGGGTTNDYREDYIEANPAVADAAGGMSIRMGNNPDYIAPLVSYKLGLQGPSLSIYTACSTSLVGVHLGVQSLLLGEIDIAVAGGVQVDLPLDVGYLHEAGGIRSADGHVRPFSAQAAGTIFSNGGAVVVLKRLADAEAAGDVIHAVLLGSAINNDGSLRAGFAAPGTDGQVKVVRAALDSSGVDARDIGLMEAHGTGTVVGDPIEVNALTQAYRSYTGEAGYCALGSVKGNVGHLGPAAGVAGLIKATLAVREGVVPPTINWEPANPGLDLERSPFRIATEAGEWAGEQTRIAAVSSFGIGGTNAHVIVAQPPVLPAREETTGPHLLTLSALTPEALTESSDRLAAYLGSSPARLDDIAFTLREGRRALPVRRTVVAGSKAEAVQQLRDGTAAPAAPVSGRREVAFLLPGQGAQYPGMGRELYDSVTSYRDAIDACSELLVTGLGLDLRTLLHADADDEAAAARLAETAVTQPATFAVEWALAAMWAARGVRPVALVGHSVGELTAAALAGVFALEDALAIVAARGALMQSVPRGSMLALPIGADAAAELLPADLELAADNSPSACVVSGDSDAVARFAAELDDIGITSTLLKTSHAFHSRMMEPILDEFADVVRSVRLKNPTVPFLSNVTGDWAEAEQVTQPGYWVSHLRRPVRFREGTSRLIRRGNPILLEVGPGRALGSFARQTAIAENQVAHWVGSLPTRRDNADAQRFVLEATGALWRAGAELDMTALRSASGVRRVEVPGYPYQRRRYWVDPDPTAVSTAVAQEEKIPRRALETPFYTPVWTQTPRVPGDIDVFGEHWLVLGSDPALTSAVGDAALGHGVTVTRVDAAEFMSEDFDSYEVDPEDPTHLATVVGQIWNGGRAPDRIIVAYDLAAGEPAAPDASLAYRSYARTAALARALVNVVREPVELVVATSRLFSVAGEASVPFSATALGPLRALPLEAPTVRVRHVDLDGAGSAEALAGKLVDEVRHASDEVVALRGHRRAVQSYATVRHSPVDGPVFRRAGVYFITGGLGGIGLTIAESLAEREQARLVLVGRSTLPDRGEWPRLVETLDPDDTVRRRIDAVLRMEAAGAQVRVIGADVADRDSIAAALKATVAEFGTLHGIIHAAGLSGGQLLALHEQATAERVLRPKVDGVLALHDCVTVEPFPELDFIALCSSIIAVTAGYGLCDYAAANLFMDAFANSQADRPDGPRVLSINWVGWKEVGMVSDRYAGEGVQALRAGGRAGREETIDHPFVQSVSVGPSGSRRYRGVLVPDAHWALTDHRIAGHAVVPATVLLEFVRAAAHHALGEIPVRIEDVLFIDPIVVTGPTTLTLSFDADGVASGAEFEITVAPGDAAGAVHCRGVLRTTDAAAPQPVDISTVRAALEPAETRRRSSGLVTFGPRFDVVREYHRTGGTGLARLEADTDDDAYWLHPAMLDQAAHGLFGTADSGYLPFSYASVRVYAPIPARAWVVQAHRADPARPEFIEVDETIVDTDGRVCVVVSSYTLRAQQPSAPADPTGNPVSPAAVAAGGAEGGSSTRPRLMISNEEGLELFRRMIAQVHQPQIITSVGSLQESIEVRRAFSIDVVSSLRDEPVATEVSRPPTLGAYAAPESDVEIAVAELWSSSLGIANVGIDDEFFVLGGSSLTAVQLASRMRERFGIDLSVAELFEHSTVRRLAVVVDRRLDVLVDQMVAEGLPDGLDRGPA